MNKLNFIFFIFLIIHVDTISQSGIQYAIVFTGVAAKWLKLNLPKAKYNFEFISPYTRK